VALFLSVSDTCSAVACQFNGRIVMIYWPTQKGPQHDQLQRSIKLSVCCNTDTGRQVRQVVEKLRMVSR